MPLTHTCERRQSDKTMPSMAFSSLHFLTCLLACTAYMQPLWRLLSATQPRFHISDDDLTRHLSHLRFFARSCALPHASISVKKKTTRPLPDHFLLQCITILLCSDAVQAPGTQSVTAGRAFGLHGPNLILSTDGSRMR